ncbi:hypothetical protein V2J09_008860 [Rumex salicifolius]
MAIKDVQQQEKVYVAVGNNLKEGLATLEWAIKKIWSSNPISIVILHANSSMSKDLVKTPFGKLPVTSVNEEKLKVLRKCEEEKIDKMLSKYMEFCGKVKAEIKKIEAQDQPIQNVTLELIMELHITKLVMAISFMRPSSGRSKSAISGSFYLHRNKPDSCDVYILCGGKLLFTREENQNQQEQIEDEEQSEMKQKPNFKGWLGKVLTSGKTTPFPSSSSTYSSSLPSPSQPANNYEFPESKSQWKMCSQEIEDYFQQLLQENDDNNHVVEDEYFCRNSPIEADVLSSPKINEDKLDNLRMQILEAKRMTQLKKDEVKAEAERQAKASWAIDLCNQRAEELETYINEDISARIDLNKETENTKEQIYEAMTDIKESKNRLDSLLETQSELSNKLQVSSLSKSRAETQLANAANARADLVREIEELRKKRGILQTRIEFCKEKDAIGMAMASKVDVLAGNGCREFSAEEIKLATDEFSEHRRLNIGGKWTNFYKGRINQNSVAIKILDLDTDAFLAKVNLLMSIRHPNIVALIGFCPELRCLVFEYMQNGCLRDILFSRRKSSRLQWHHRISIAAEVGSALSFLHVNGPKPITHGNLNTSNILLDNNLACKLDTYELAPDVTEQVDVHAFGILLLQLLCGRNWAGVSQETLLVDGKQSIIDALDRNGGEWLLDLVEEIVGVALKCTSVDSERAGKVMSSAVMTLSLVKKKAEGLKSVDKCERRECETRGVLVEEDEESGVPSIFLCPIYKGIMENPHIAADGYSYEFEAIEEWLQTGHNASPVTKTMLLENKLVTPNHALRALIQEWRTQTLF